jgi:MFS family permease
MIADYVGALRRFSRDVRLYLLAAALQAIAWDGIRTVLSNLYLLRLGYRPRTIGLLGAVGPGVFTLVCMPAGAAGKRWGYRRALIAGTALLFGGVGLLPVVEFVPSPWAIGWLVGANAVMGLGLALAFVCGVPFLVAATGPQERDHAFSMHAAIVPLAAFLGSLLGGALPGMLAPLLGVTTEAPAAYRYPLWIAALLGSAGVFLLRATRGVSIERPQSQTAAALRPPYGLIAVVALVIMFRYAGNGAVTTFYNVYLDDGLGAATFLIGALVAVGKLLAVPAALLTPLLIARWGKERAVVLGSLALALSILPLALLPHWSAAGLGYVGVSACFAITTTIIRVYSQELVSPAWRSAMSGALMMGAGLSASAIASGGGYLIAAVGYSGLFLIGAGLTVVGALVFWACFRVPRGELAHRAGASAAE